MPQASSAFFTNRTAIENMPGGSVDIASTVPLTLFYDIDLKHGSVSSWVYGCCPYKGRGKNAHVAKTIVFIRYTSIPLETGRIAI